MQEVSDYELLELALGGNWLRLTLNSDPRAKRIWLKAISYWRNMNVNILSWCTKIGKAWDQTPFFYGVVVEPTNGTIYIEESPEFRFKFYIFPTTYWRKREEISDLLTLPKDCIGIPRHESPTYKHKLERMVRDAIRCWNLLSLRFRVPKDLRQKIADLIWDSRSEWI